MQTLDFILGLHNCLEFFQPDINTSQRGWENSRQLCKPSTSSRVCITVSNSPNPSRIYIRLCKHGKRFLLLDCCFSDVDECTFDTHDCHANATCNNTVGSFSCHCKTTAGYIGNGKICYPHRKPCHLCIYHLYLYILFHLVFIERM